MVWRYASCMVNDPVVLSSSAYRWIRLCLLVIGRVKSNRQSLIHIGLALLAVFRFNYTRLFLEITHHTSRESKTN